MDYSVGSDQDPLTFEESIDALTDIKKNISDSSLDEVNEKITGIINHLSSQSEKLQGEVDRLNRGTSSIVHRYRVKNTIDELEAKIANIQKMKSYARHIQAEIESRSFAEMRAQSASRHGSRLSIQKLLDEVKNNDKEQVQEIAAILKNQYKLTCSHVQPVDLLKKIEEEIPIAMKDERLTGLIDQLNLLDGLNHLQIIMMKCTRSEEKRNLTTADIHHLHTLDDSMGKIAGQTSSPSWRELGEIIGEMRLEVDRAFEQGINALFKIELGDEVMAMIQNDETDHRTYTQEEKGILFGRCSDLFWRFNDPFEMHLGIPLVCTTLLAALDGSKNSLTSWVQSLGDEEKKELRSKATFLKDHADQIENIALLRGRGGSESHPSRKTMIAWKDQFLQGVRSRNKKRGGQSLSINIVGGGPGGMIRLLIAGVKGHQGRVIEMREQYTRDNMVKLKESATMKYFGVRERLLEKGVILGDSQSDHPIEVKLKDLEEVFEEIAAKIYGEEEYRITGKLVDLVQGKKGEAGCLVKMGAPNGIMEEKIFSSDLHVDSTGARGDLGAMIGLGTKPIADSQIMVALIRQKSSQREGERKKEGKEFLLTVPLSTPDLDYSLIQPTPKNQEKLRILMDEKNRLKKAADGLKQNIDRFDHSSAHQLYQGNIEAALAPKKRLELHKMIGDPRRYETRLMELARIQLSRLNDEMSHKEDSIQRILYAIASEQQGEKLKRRDIKQIAPFNIELRQREEPSVMYGDSLIMYSGDALATPDPKSGAGVGHAIAGGTLFSQTLDDRSHGLPLSMIQLRFDYGSKLQMDKVTREGLAARLAIREEDPRLATSYLFEESLKLGFLHNDDIDLLQRLLPKKKYGALLSLQEREKMAQLKLQLKSKSLFTANQTTIMKGIDQLLTSLLG